MSSAAVARNGNFWMIGTLQMVLLVVELWPWLADSSTLLESETDRIGVRRLTLKLSILRVLRTVQSGVVIPTPILRAASTLT